MDNKDFKDGDVVILHEGKVDDKYVRTKGSWFKGSLMAICFSDAIIRYEMNRKKHTFISAN